MSSLSEELDDFASAYRGGDRPRPYTPEPARRRRPCGGNTAGSTRDGWAASGHKGAYKLPSGRFTSQTRFNGKCYSCGTHDTAEAASAAAAAKAAELRAAAELRKEGTE